ncbi:uncharacterized protein LOC130090616 isoform X1 [Rhinichthys klamathensis goyatoka]|uniref:uncharacterized protein LOC130090616 isoform X1 n=1 Tax=Rhinichthys klamathensis goyatoka TaxID=3034132 RepID=UPI0024B4F1D6|nr:uncharacterized protein LOC130090616 isoform X1 [Rhinichthys klamathensis goyatoka]
MCDTAVIWNGWYRLFIQGQSAQMPDTCVDVYRCGTFTPLWLNGGHPTVEDGVVTRAVCGNWTNNCCYFQSNPIKIKACPGNYYVYKFVSPISCHSAYCAEVRNITTNNATVTPNTTLADPCYSYTALNDSWRATNNLFSSQLMCDARGFWNGWYRLFIQGQSVQMADTCVDEHSCGTAAPLWLNGGHPKVKDGVVTRAVCGHWKNNCCYFQSNPIKVKACPGNYYVYEFVSPTSCHSAYCAEVRNIIINNPTVTPNTTLADPCFSYTELNDSWRATNNHQPQWCDTAVNWHGWYRLFIQNQSAQMPDTCVATLSCGTAAPLWLNGGHPQIEDGVVTRAVCGNWLNDCCMFRSNPIKVKACPGNYYVYEFVSPIGCFLAYCAEVRDITTNNATVTPNTAPGIFYPFGSSGDTINPAVDDGSSSVIPLLGPFLFFGHTYQQIYVNNNGHLTFNQPSDQIVPYSFPANGSQDIIAGLWTDLDNRVRGVVSYHQYTNGSVLTRATQDINNHFPNLTFSASWVFVATWDKVPYYPITNTETSFQVVLISGTHFSYILMNYGDIAVTGLPVEAGYVTVNSTDYFVIPGSNIGNSISNLKNSSNVNVPGRWAFRVDSGHNTSKNNIIGLQMKLSSFSDLTQSGNIEIVLQQIKQVLVKNGLQSNIELELRKVQKIKP